MKKYFAYAAALSLALAACGDDSSSNADGKGTVSNKQLSSVIANSGPCSQNRVEGNLAYLTNDDNAGYQITIPDVSAIGYYKNTELDAERVGDTLFIKDTQDTLWDWICYVYYTFNIPAEYADVKYIAYFSGAYEVVPGPAPEKAPDTLCHYLRSPDKVYADDVYDTVCTICTFSPSAAGVYDSSCTDFPYDVHKSSSSESAKSSSSSAVPPGTSSSSIEPGSSSGVTPPSSSSKREYNGPVPLKSITATCQEKVWTNEPVVDPVLPAAYYSVSNSFAQIDLLNVKLTYACDSALQKAFWDNLNADNTVASVIGDTLFVNIDHSGEKGVKLECGCTADVKFTFDENYAVFGYTAFENNRPPLKLEQRSINQPNLGYQKITKADAQCLGNDSPNDPMVDAALPPVAHMYVNGDSAQVVIEQVSVTCAAIIESIEAQVKDSVLYVTPHYDTSVPQADCICNTKVTFNVAARSPFTEATLLVYDNDPGNKMRLIVE